MYLHVLISAPAVPWPGCTAQVECSVLPHHSSQCSPYRPAWDHRCSAQVQDALLCKCRQCSLSSTKSKHTNLLHYLYHVYLVCCASQLQLTQRIPVPQEPVSIIVPIVYDMATGLTQQADIPRQHSSSGAAALMVSNILKRFNELHPARQGERRHCKLMNTVFYWTEKLMLKHWHIFFLPQVSAPYLLLFTSWWPTSHCPPALVSRNNKFKAITGSQLEPL